MKITISFETTTTKQGGRRTTPAYMEVFADLVHRLAVIDFIRDVSSHSPGRMTYKVQRHAVVSHIKCTIFKLEIQHFNMLLNLITEVQLFLLILFHVSTCQLLSYIC